MERKQFCGHILSFFRSRGTQSVVVHSFNEKGCQTATRLQKENKMSNHKGYKESKMSKSKMLSEINN